MSTIYLNDTSKPIRPPHSNDCNDHNTSISVGGNGGSFGGGGASGSWDSSSDSSSD